MKRGRYEMVPTSWLRILIHSTASWPWCAVLRNVRLKADDELTSRAIQEILSKDYDAQPVVRIADWN